MSSTSLRKHYTMDKIASKSTPLTDALGAVATGLLPLGGIANGVGAIYGSLDRDRYDQQDVGSAFIPGVGVARLRNRVKSQIAKEIKDTEENPEDRNARPVRHAVSELLGNGTSVLASTGVGAGIGKLLGNTGKGARIGAAVGASGVLGGLLLSAIRRRRTAKEQIDNDKKTILKDLLVPGVASYNSSKRLGRSQGDRDELEAKRYGKSAEYRGIGVSDDYMHGFCKTAYSYNVNPKSLIKTALSLKAIATLAAMPMAAGAIGGKISQELGGDSSRNARIGAVSGAAALGGVHAYKTNKAIDNASMRFFGSKAPGKLKILPLLGAFGAGGLIGSVGGGFIGSLFGKKEKPKKTFLEELLSKIRERGL